MSTLVHVQADLFSSSNSLDNLSIQNTHFMFILTTPFKASDDAIAARRIVTLTPNSPDLIHYIMTFGMNFNSWCSKPSENYFSHSS
jgi:hypothetical protein